MQEVIFKVYVYKAVTCILLIWQKCQSTMSYDTKNFSMMHNVSNIVLLIYLCNILLMVHYLTKKDKNIYNNFFCVF